MSSATQTRKPRTKPARSIRWEVRPTAVKPQGVLTIVCGKDTDHYFIEPIASDFGRAFKLTKFVQFGGEEYDVLLDGERSTCECKGFLKHRHCKHLSGLMTLLAK